jgi:hypothetical protein
LYIERNIKLKTKNKPTNEINLRDFDAWSGAVDTKEILINEGKEDEFNSLIEDLYGGGLSETQLNDILWFEEEWIFKSLGIDIE